MRKHMRDMLPSCAQQTNLECVSLLPLLTSNKPILETRHHIISKYNSIGGCVKRTFMQTSGNTHIYVCTHTHAYSNAFVCACARVCVCISDMMLTPVYGCAFLNTLMQ